MKMSEYFQELEDSPQFNKTIKGKIIRVGRQDEKEPYPILYLNELLAIDMLKSDVLTLIQNKLWCWVKFPVIEKFQMTESPVGLITHRVVQPRYAGYCEIEVLDEPA